MAKVKLLDPGDPKRKLDRYELIGEIATGGMATVFLARLGGVGGFKRFVAIKRLHPHLAAEQEFVEMFLDEARLAALIHHPNVVPILEVGTSDSGYYLVMEYVEGDTLSKLVARTMSQGKMVPRHILVRILLDTLNGLDAAHELGDERGQLLGLVHRDVSPQNVLIGIDGSSRITDFGVARATARLTTTGSGKLKGKLAYMAPEQTRGDDLDRRTDLFAAGVIAWEVLAGRRLFKAESEAATLNRILVEPIRPMSAFNAEVPKPFDDVVLKALSRETNKRFQTAAEMAEALERAANEAAKQSSADIGVASPRDVAAFVQTVIGQEIAAQRESVRAWLAQTDSGNVKISLPPRSPSSPDPLGDGQDRTASSPPPHLEASSGSVSSIPSPPPSSGGTPAVGVSVLADVTMRFALGGSSPPRPVPPAKQSQPTLIGQPPPPRSQNGASEAPASSDPNAPTPSTGLGVARLGDEGDDAPTVARVTRSDPPGGVPAGHAALKPTVKTARGLFASDLLLKAQLEVERAGGSAPPPANVAAVRGGTWNMESGILNAGGGQVPVLEAQPLPLHGAGDNTGVASLSSAPAAHPYGQTGSGLTNGSMTLPTAASYPPRFEVLAEPIPKRRGPLVAVLVLLGLIGLGAGGFFFLRWQEQNVTSIEAPPEPKPGATARPAETQTPTATAPTPTTTALSIDALPSVAPSATTSAAPAVAATSDRRNTGGRRTPKTPQPKTTATAATPDPPPTPTSAPTGDDLSNPYR